MSPASAAPIAARLDAAALPAPAVRVAARRDEPHPRPLAGRAVDLEAAAEQRQPLADAEQPPTHLAGLRSIVESCRFEPDALIRHGDAQLIVGVERQLQRDAIRLGVFDRVEQELSHRLEEQRADVLPPGIGARIGDDGTSSLYLSCVQFASHFSAAGSPECCSTGGNSSKFSDRAAAIASSSWCLASQSSSLGAAPPSLSRFSCCSRFNAAMTSSCCKPVVQRPGDLLARMLLGQRQVRRHPAQLRRPVFQFGRALLQRRRGALAIGDVGHERERASAAGVGT